MGEYVLTATKAKTLSKRMNHDLFCAKCLQPLQAGDVVISRAKGKNYSKRTQHYHKACLESLYL